MYNWKNAFMMYSLCTKYILYSENPFVNLIVVTALECLLVSWRSNNMLVWRTGSYYVSCGSSAFYILFKLDFLSICYNPLWQIKIALQRKKNIGSKKYLPQGSFTFLSKSLKSNFEIVLPWLAPSALTQKSFSCHILFLLSWHKVNTGLA